MEDVRGAAVTDHEVWEHSNPQRIRETFEGLSAELIDGLWAARPKRYERRGWLYDPEWRYFVHDGSAVQSIATAESVEAGVDWAFDLGLDRETVAWLLAHPTAGAYAKAR